MALHAECLSASEVMATGSHDCSLLASPVESEDDQELRRTVSGARPRRFTWLIAGAALVALLAAACYVWHGPGPRQGSRYAQQAWAATAGGGQAVQEQSAGGNVGNAAEEQGSTGEGLASDGLAGYGQAGQENSRLGSFLVIGDWGYDAHVHGDGHHNAPMGAQCQKAIAQKMHEVMESLGDVKFVINVGDSFYPNGVKDKSDWQWDAKWRQIYSEKLRSVPWYSVYGNHDYIGDPCACGNGPKQCAQIHNDTSNLDYFYMPDLNWFREHPELGLEVIALDTNQYEYGWDEYAVKHHACPPSCKYTPCEETCEWNLKYRAMDAFKLFRERSATSTAKNLIVFSHYPTDFFKAVPEFLDGLRDNSRHHVEYFAGHRHSTDQWSGVSIEPNNQWLVGGGGGWECGTSEQGFVVGEIDLNQKISTHAVLVDPMTCCGKSGKYVNYERDYKGPKTPTCKVH
eukprot:TRINITY_DN44003_c0_g1_i1.p1 TRINITY_DN44003_c0_g1~~TRINITY_DN44003_c0_g1_i1.p1  ORF type:complete len:457 (+),score=58.61 TRINITY_DN44003_c0_g1_i1:19-1389(+)